MKLLDSYNDLLRAVIKLDRDLSRCCDTTRAEAVARTGSDEPGVVSHDPGYAAASAAYCEFARIRLAIEHLGDVIGGH